MHICIFIFIIRHFFSNIAPSCIRICVYFLFVCLVLYVIVIVLSVRINIIIIIKLSHVSCHKQCKIFSDLA